jgi:hypothetical protein
MNPDNNITLLYVSEGRKEVQGGMLRWEVKYGELLQTDDHTVRQEMPFQVKTLILKLVWRV